MLDLSHPNSPLNGGKHIEFTLPAVLTVETIDQLAAEFKQWPLREKTTVTLDASQVENITTPGIQLLVSLEKTLAGQGGKLAIIKKQKALLRAFQDAGLESALGKQD